MAISWLSWTSSVARCERPDSHRRHPMTPVKATKEEKLLVLGDRVVGIANNLTEAGIPCKFSVAFGKFTFNLDTTRLAAKSKPSKREKNARTSRDAISSDGLSLFWDRNSRTCPRMLRLRIVFLPKVMPSWRRGGRGEVKGTRVRRWRKMIMKPTGHKRKLHYNPSWKPSFPWIRRSWPILRSWRLP